MPDCVSHLMLMKIALIILSVVLFGLFVSGAIFNLKSWLKRGNSERYPSIVPLFPGIAGCVSLAIFPLYPLARLSWLPLVLDVGCLPYFFGASAYLIHDRWITNPWYKVKELHSQTSEFELKVKLFRTGQVRLLKTNLVPCPPVITEPHWISIGSCGEWIEENDTLALNTHQGKLTYQKVAPNKYLWVSSDEPTAFDHIDLESR